MTLLETLALLTFMLGLLSLIVDVVRLTLEVMDKFSQKKICCKSRSTSGRIFGSKTASINSENKTGGGAGGFCFVRGRAL